MSNNHSAFAFPGIRKDNGERFEKQDGMSMLEYYAAHAPECPEWYRDMFYPDLKTNKAKSQDKSITVLSRKDFFEIELEIFISWRYYYDKQMINTIK